MQLDTIVCSDAIDFLKTLPDRSIHAIISDPPYGRTQLKNDDPIDWSPFWVEAKRILVDANCPIVLFSQQPFTTDLINSNRKAFRYERIWHKTMPVGFLDAKRRPLRAHENILVFGFKMPRYYPQMSIASHKRATAFHAGEGRAEHYSRHSRAGKWEDNGLRYPRSVIEVAQRTSSFKKTKTNHPNEKPLALTEDLVMLYSQPGEVVLDCFCGSGSTFVAARKLDRRYVGCDKNPMYVAVTQQRLNSSDPYKDRLMPDGLQLFLFREIGNSSVSRDVSVPSSEKE